MKKQRGRNTALRQQAEALFAERPQDAVIFEKDASALIHELQVHQIELEIQNEELRTAQTSIETSRKRFVELYDFAPVGYCTVDDAGRIKQINLTAVHLLGYDRLFLLDKPLASFVYRDDKDVLFRFLRKLRQEAVEQRCELRLKRKNVAAFFAELMSRPLDDTAGAAHEFLVAIIDITLRKQAEEAPNLLAAIVTTSDDAIISKTLDGIITSWNAGAQKIYGYPAEEVQGKPITILSPPDRADEIPGILRKIRAGELIEHFETIRVKKDGTRIPVSLTISPLKAHDGTITGASSIARDISAQKQMEEALRRSEENARRRAADLAEANAELDSFAHSVSHDLRAPLRSIIGFTHILLEDFGDTLADEAKGYLARIIKNGESMNALMNDLLELSKISRRELQLLDVNLSTVASSVMEELRESEPGRQVEITIEENMLAFADRRLMKIALTNLLGNAWKYTAKIGRAKIEMKTLKQNGHTIYLIRDTGAGFEIYPDRLFKPFQRFHSESEFAGTGIGLSIVERIIRRHGGKIWAESEPGKGASFFFYLREKTKEHQ